MADDDGVGSAAEISWCAGLDAGWPGRIGYEEPGLLCGELEGVDTVGRVVDHKLAIGRVGVDIEVKAGGAGLASEPVDTMASVLVDP